ncbi:MAG TPA: fibronectin type III domain-containing protein, partial [Acidobacteriota bacterium]
GLSALGNNAALQWNALYTKDPDLKAFLAKIIRYDLEATQTVAPENLRVVAATPTTVELRWDPIKYTGEAGGYRVFYGVSPGGPYTFFDETPNKTVSSMTVTGLDPKSTRYYFAVQAVTYPHKANQTTVVSDFGSEVSVVRGPVDFYFPFYQSSVDTFTGFAVSNFSGERANLSFTGFDASGQPSPALGALNFSLPPGHQFAMLGSEFLRSFQAGWVRLISDNPDIGSFFQFGATGQLDGSSSIIGQSRKFYFTRIFEGPNAFRGQHATTFLSIANPNDHAISLNLTLRGAAPDQNGSSTKVTRTLPAKGWLFEPVSQIFGLTSQASNGYVEAEVISGSGAVGFESIQLPESRTLIGLNASFGNVTDELYSAHLANEQLAFGIAFFTNLKLVNVSDEPRTLMVRAIYSGGFNLPVDLTLAPGEVLQEDVRDLFGALVPTTSSIRIEASGPGVIGDVIFGDVFTSRYAAAMPLQTRKFTRAVFSHVANALNFFTGIALYNPGSRPANVTVEVFSDQGVMTGQTSFQLGGASRISKLLAELLPSTAGQAGGYLVVRSTEPLVAQQLFGDAALNFLSAVPPTIVESAP